ncbi:MAG: hypothetical protein Tsb0013_10000 [Phycisphaerales bacterium]
MAGAGITEHEIVTLVTDFEECFNTNDIDGAMSRMSDAPVFEHMAPPEVSVGRHEGYDAVRAVWESLPSHFPGALFRIDDIFACCDRCTCRYTLTFVGPDGGTVTRVGVDVFRIESGKISEKLTYLTL